MKRSLYLLVAATLFIASSPLSAQPVSRNTARERRIEEALASVSVAAVPTFRRATQAMDAGKFAEAEPLFREVLVSAPRFTPAMRRLGGVIMELGRDADGIALLNHAVQLDRSPENLISLATALAYRAGDRLGSTEERKTALGLATEAAQMNHDAEDASYDAAAAQIALSLDDTVAFHQTVDTMNRKYPRAIATRYYAAVDAAIDEHWEKAEDEIREAERLGLPHDVASRFLSSGVHSRATAWRYARYTLYALIVWAAGLGLLLAAGRGLSLRTLSSIEQADPNVLASDSERSLRRIYRVLINCAGAYYYLSLPFVVVLVVGGTAAVVYGFMMIGHIPVKLVALLVVGALITIVKMVQSLFIKTTTEDPGRMLEEAEAPALWQLARDVAASVGTRPVDEIRVTPGTDMAVYERGTASQRRHDLAHRVLVIGVGLLNGFEQGAFRSVLAHEYGHFAHRDTAGGDVALRVRRDMVMFAIALAKQGQAVGWNLAFQFLRLYDFLFRRISHGAVRLQEVLADRRAAHLYGPAAFAQGLRHVIARSVEFDAAVTVELQSAFNAKRSVSNLYALPPLPELSSTDVEHRIADAMSRPTTEDDTHPGPSDRVRLIQRVTHSDARSDATPVWDLFSNPHQLMTEMTAMVAEQISNANATAA